MATPSSTTTILLSCHDPTKKIELLCNGCLRPITDMPYYKCADKDNKCYFVLHEWCTRLPAKLQDYTNHKQHTLILQTNASNKFFSVFDCDVCELSCNGFVYTCVQCDYLIDVKCAFLPEKITHEAHPSHLMSRVELKYPFSACRLCRNRKNRQLVFHCDTCSDEWVHAKCAMLLPREIKHKYDKHLMSISYNPIENHKSEYFCEVCEEEFDPELCFYHCYQCAQSIHTHCAPLILQSERAATYSQFSSSGVYKFVNIKFGGTHSIKDHHHSLLFSQGIQSDGICSKCHTILHNTMIFKCQQCSAYAIHLDCCKDLSDI
uniref:uncharacterized protein LOC122608591 n=1 Tax=Erigeron canadensis TaxID=72917 RepID=UPI001CB90A16|nr:uncharacterized protein LOC122608591 [Erigeron canadensis]